MVTVKKIFKIGMVLMAVALWANLSGCGKGKAKQSGESDLDAQLKAAVAQLQGKKQPYTGNLTPEKAAEITHEVSAKSMAAFPTGEALPKDPQELTKINDKIHEETEKIYAKYGTSSSDMMRFISEMSPKQREIYNERLTELFLESSKKKYGADKPAPNQKAPAPAQAQPAAAQPKK